MKMAGNNRPNGENQNQRFQKPRHGDRQNGQGDRQNGHGDRQNGHGDRQNGQGDRYNGQGDRHNGQGDRYNGFGDRQNGHGDRYNGQGDRHNGHGDQKFNRNRPNRNQPPPPHQKACQSSLPLPRKNTVNFDPSHEPPQMRIIAAEPGLKKYIQSPLVIVDSSVSSKLSTITRESTITKEIHAKIDIWSA